MLRDLTDAEYEGWKRESFLSSIRFLHSSKTGQQKLAELIRNFLFTYPENCDSIAITVKKALNEIPDYLNKIIEDEKRQMKFDFF